ncbi:hypothetical protein [Pedobacter panaciterrae]
MDYTLPYIGNINLKELKEDYHVLIETSGNTVAIDLNFENTSIDKEMADGINTFLQNIDKQDQHNRAVIAKDFEEKESETTSYLNFYLTEFDEAELLRIVGNQTKKKHSRRITKQAAINPDRIISGW